MVLALESHRVSGVHAAGEPLPSRRLLLRAGRSVLLPPGRGGQVVLSRQ